MFQLVLLYVAFASFPCMFMIFFPSNYTPLSNMHAKFTGHAKFSFA